MFFYTLRMSAQCICTLCFRPKNVPKCTKTSFLQSENIKMMFIDFLSREKTDVRGHKNGINLVERKNTECKKCRKKKYRKFY